MPRRDPYYLTTADVAAECGVSVDAVRRLVRLGRLPDRRAQLGRRRVLLFSAEDLDEALLYLERLEARGRRYVPVRLTFAPQVLAELRRRADERGISLSAFMRELVDQALDAGAATPQDRRSELAERAALALETFRAESHGSLAGQADRVVPLEADG